MKNLLALLILAPLAACVGPMEKPRNVDEQMVLAVKIHDGIVKSISTGLDLQSITPTQGRQAFNALAQARTGMDAARTANAGCVDQKTGAKVYEMPGVVAPASPPTPGQMPVLLVQMIRCNPTTTALDQLAIANSFLTRLAIYYQAQGAK